MQVIINAIVILQCLVLTTTYFFNIQQGFNVMMPTVIIAAMRKKGQDTLADITENQLSWIGNWVLKYYSTVSHQLGTNCKVIHLTCPVRTTHKFQSTFVSRISFDLKIITVNS